MNLQTPERIAQSRISILNYLPAAADSALVRRILTGLSAKQKYISSMFFYDTVGSQLFEDITALPEYYLARTEKALLKEASSHLSSLLCDLDLIELGSGDGSKISLLLDAVDARARATLRYIPLDVSESAVHKSAQTLNRHYPEIPIVGMIADFVTQISLIPRGQRRLFCFFGSTLGNLSPARAQCFIRNVSRLMQHGDHLLLGLDRVKEVNVLHAAYNDRRQVTAAFNRNILNVVNAYTRSDFNPELFEHLAFYNPDRSRIEMHLKASRSMQVRCPLLKKPLPLSEGETIHTENSYKFTDSDIVTLSRTSGLEIMDTWTDSRQWFTLVRLGKP